MMEDLGLKVRCVSIHAEESYPSDLKPDEVPTFLAEKKSRHFTDDLTDALLITADTVVVLNDTILEKPVDPSDAQRMLKLLSGNTHRVITGVCLRSNQKTVSFSSTTEVTFRTLSEEEISHYITEYQPFDKAGSYGIQEWIGYVGVERISGCFYNVVGLPLSEFYQQLKNF